MFIGSILITHNGGKTTAAIVPSARLAFSRAAFAVRAWGGLGMRSAMKTSVVKWCASTRAFAISLKMDYLKQTARRNGNDKESWHN